MKAVDKKVGETIYYKYKINLPKRIVEESKFLNRELQIRFDKDKIVIERNNNQGNQRANS